MEPLKPEVKKKILETTDATPEDIEEYERLQAKRYTLGHRRPKLPEGMPVESVLPGAAEAQKDLADIEGRISQLHRKLFPDKQ